MPSVEDLHRHLQRLAAAHQAHAEHITAAGEQVAAELDRSRAAADSVPLRDEIEDYVAPEPDADHPGG